MKVKAHLHLPRYKAFTKGGHEAVISVTPYAFVRGISKTEYAGTVTLTNVKFRVSQPGRIRTLTTGVKNVHAWVIGDVVVQTAGQYPPKSVDKWRQARYNPRETETFVDRETGLPVHSAKAALMVGARVYYIPED